MLITFFVILLDMIGFGIMVPIMAFYALQLGASPGVATLCMALYVVGMFISTPLLGRLSDIYGRRPVLLISMAGAAVGYILLGFADTVLLVALSRLFSGLMAGNLAAAQAYMTDVSSEEKRAQAMGLIGAAFGLGFIVGPVIGSWLAGDDFWNANLQLPAMVSAAMSALAFLVILFRLPESLDAETRAANRARIQPGRLTAMRQVLAIPLLLQLIAAGVIYNLAAGFAEVIFPIWAEANGVASGPKALIPFLLIAGLAMVIMQAGLIGPLAKRFGERRLLMAGSVSFFCAMSVLCVAGNQSSSAGVLVGLVLQSIGAALVLTPLQTLVSKCADPGNRGLIMGVYSSLGTAGRGVGTAVTGLTFAAIAPNASYAAAALAMLLLFALALYLHKQHIRPVHLEPANLNGANHESAS